MGRLCLRTLDEHTRGKAGADPREPQRVLFVELRLIRTHGTAAALWSPMPGGLGQLIPFTLQRPTPLPFIFYLHCLTRSPHHIVGFIFHIADSASTAALVYLAACPVRPRAGRSVIKVSRSSNSGALARGTSARAPWAVVKVMCAQESTCAQESAAVKKAVYGVQYRKYVTVLYSVP